jgi:sugar phosphate permease
VVVGWFPPQRRGLAMGIRQMAQPLGVGLAALTVPTIAVGYGVGAALWLPAALAAVAAILCFVVVIDPARLARTDPAAAEQLANPYRRSGFLWRIHAVSVLLVVPQFMVWTFGLVWLISDRGWSPGAAGTLIAITQLLGALGRMAAGQLSDRVRSRMRPLRWVAIAAAATMIMLAAADQLDWSVAIGLLVVATVVTVADNGLAFTSIAEMAGPFWSGRALGAQNTAQFLTASLVPPVLGAAITVLGFPLAFAVTALCPVIAIPLVPVRQEKSIN